MQTQRLDDGKHKTQDSKIGEKGASLLFDFHRYACATSSKGGTDVQHTFVGYALEGL